MVFVVLALAVVFGVAAAVLAAAETAVMLLPPGRVHRLVEAERRGAVQLEALAARPYRVRAASALCAGLAFASVAMLGVEVGARVGSAIVAAWELLAALLGVIVMFALAQALPRALAVANPEDVASGRPHRPRVFSCRCSIRWRACSRRPFAWVDQRGRRGAGRCRRGPQPPSTAPSTPTRRPTAKRPRRRCSRPSPTSPRRSCARSWSRAPT